MHGWRISGWAELLITLEQVPRQGKSSRRSANEARRASCWNDVRDLIFRCSQFDRSYCLIRWKDDY